jgi:nucleotide-binding universal stress UspA family protein
MIKLKTILVPTDFSECSEAAVKYGLELARAFDAKLHLLHVVEDPYTMPWAAEGLGRTIDEWVEQSQSECRKRLLESVPEGDRGRVVVACPITSPCDEIIGYATDENVDLIVMGTHGRGFVAHVLLGSVVERVIRRAPCPVLSVRHPQHGFVEPATEPILAVALS